MVARMPGVVPRDVEAGGDLIDRLLEDDVEPQVSIILGELRSIIDNVVYHVNIDSDEWEFVQTTQSHGLGCAYRGVHACVPMHSRRAW